MSLFLHFSPKSSLSLRMTLYLRFLPKTSFYPRMSLYLRFSQKNSLISENESLPTFYTKKLRFAEDMDALFLQGFLTIKLALNWII